MIRQAKESDLPRIIEMGLRFYTESQYKDHIAKNPRQIESLAKSILANGICFVAESCRAVVGMICVLCFPHPISAELTAIELSWWVEPEHRGGCIAIRLLNAAEREARKRGVKLFQMIAPNPDTCAMYERMGYRYIESAYGKRL